MLEYITEQTRKGVPRYQIEKDLGWPRDSITKYLKQFNTSIKELRFNHRYFQNLDTEEKAYWLGFLTADGCVGNNGQIRIALNHKDKKHLEKWHQAINSMYEVEVTHYKNTVNPVCISTHCSVLMKKDLKKYGCVPRKSHICQIKNVPEHLIRHFIRGYFDGDGSISARKQKIHHRPSMFIHFCSGSKKILEQIHTFLNSKAKIIKAIDGSYYHLAYGGNNVCTKIYDLLYINSTIYLDRKKEKFDSIFEEIQQCEKKNPKEKTCAGFGEKKTINEWCLDSRLKVKKSLFKQRVYALKWNIEKALCQIN